MHKVSHNGERILPVYRQFPAPEGQVGFIGQRACSVILLSVTGSFYDILCVLVSVGSVVDIQ